MTPRHAHIALPNATLADIAEQSAFRWLKRGRIANAAAGMELPEQLAESFGISVGNEGRAALRYWGQTGQAPDGWIAAADPVFIEARLRDVVLREIPPSLLTSDDVAEIFSTLEDRLGDCDGETFICHGSLGYLQSGSELETPVDSVASLDGKAPAPDRAGKQPANSTEQINSEIQMVLHDHPTNARRADAGLPPINSLWIWGGGVAPKVMPRELPPLFGDDPLCRGYWFSCGRTPADKPQELQQCLDQSSGSFVVVNSADFAVEIERILEQSRMALKSGKLSGMTIYFGGNTVDIRRADLYKFWRGLASTKVEQVTDA